MLGIDAGRLGRSSSGVGCSAGVRQACGPSGVPRFRESWSLREAIAGRGTFLTSVWPGCVWWEPSSLLADSFNKCCCHIDWGMRRVASGVGLFCGDSPLSCILLASCSGLLICLIPHFLPGIPASLLRSCLLADLPTYSACPCQTCRPTSLSPTCVVWWVLNDFAS